MELKLAFDTLLEAFALLGKEKRALKEENKILKEKNELLKEEKETLLRQLNTKDTPFEKQVIRLMTENRELTKKLEDVNKIHTLKGELQRELKEQSECMPRTLKPH